MQIKLTKTDKAQNSTYRPTSWNVVTTCDLKDMCDISSPELVFSGVANVHTYNYAYSPEFNRYYFITDWTYDRGTWIASCNIDVLATWKNTIGSSMQYIVRSAVAGDVVDDMITPTLEDGHVKYPLTDVISDDGNVGSPVLGTYFVKTATTSDEGIQSGVALYAMTRGEFIDFVAELSTTSYMGIVEEIDNITENVAKLLLNPAQYIISARYLPISRTKLQQFGATLVENKHIKYGWYTLNSTASVVTNYPKVKFSLYAGETPKHLYANPQDGCNKKQFLTNKYTSFKLEYPMLGMVEIPNNYFIDSDLMYINGILDLMDLTVIVVADIFERLDSGDVKELGANLPININNWGIDIPINNFIRDVRAEMSSAVSLVTNLRGTAANMFAGNFIGAAGGAVNTIRSAAEFAGASHAASVQMQGSSGGYASLAFSRWLHVFYSVPNEAVPSRYIGKSTMKMGTISAYARHNNISYLTTCYSPIINIINTNEPKYLAGEYEQIISYMSEGFYYD